jgi:GST-like protein
MAGYTLIGSNGTGSAITEAMLELSGLSYRVERIPYLEEGPQRERLLALNPLGQVPTMILPDGQVMTESAAMTLHVADRAPQAHLVPPADAPERPAFLRWLIFLVGAIYPTFTYADIPERWTFEGAPADELRRRIFVHREAMWRHLEEQVRVPWFLGERSCALDLYVCVMTMWRPRRSWFAANCPKLTAIAEHASSIPAVATVLQRNEED